MVPNTGSLIVRTFVSKAQLPVPGATVIIYTDRDDGRHTLVAIRITDESGIAGPVKLSTTESQGLTPDAPVPFTDYQMIVEHPNYQLASYQNLQIFPNIETVQDVLLLPLSVPESPDSNVTIITPQPL